MKIFALNLCLSFEVIDQKKNYEFPRITFEELMGHLFKGGELEGKIYYVDAANEENILQHVFDLQTNDVFRDFDVNVIFQFKSESQLEDFTFDFKDMFRQTDAAGGLVINEKGEYLCILNRNKWTLPKGGVEWLEPVDEAAVREVKEETGLEEVKILHPFQKTFHTFRRKRKWVLKTTHWYNMEASSDSSLTPQAEEDIEDVKWVSKEEWIKLSQQSYPLIRHLFEAEFAKSLTS
ncbi:MAG: NUDIX domain-containing protein [Bacteroidia bacterium]|nr:NUDIX domain-containing protein [Bacteroidia bacterium]